MECTPTVCGCVLNREQWLTECTPTVCLCVEQGAVVDGVYTRGVHAPAAVAAVPLVKPPSASPGVVQPPVSSSAVTSPPVKTGILPPTSNVNTVATGSSQDRVHDQASRPVTRTHTGWREFEEALSEEFISPSATVSSHQPQDVDVPTSYNPLPQQFKAPGLMMPSIASLYTLYLICYNALVMFT